MKVNVIRSENLSHQLEVIIPAGDIQSKTDARLTEHGKTAVIRGFRKGKIPLNILKLRFGKSVRNEIVQTTVFETYQIALQEKQIKAATQPNIELKSADEGTDLVYQISVESLPGIEIADFKNIELIKPVAKLEESEVEQELNNLAEKFPLTEAVNREANEGDTVVIDFNGRTLDDNETQEALQGEGVRMKLGARQLLADFDLQLVGKRAGDSKEVNVEFPEGYTNPELAGREALIDVKVQEVREPVETEVGDELAHSLGVENLAALRNIVIGQLNAAREELSHAVLKREVLDYLEKTNQFEIPVGMTRVVDAELESVLKQAEADLRNQGETTGLTDEEREECREIAEHRVRLGLIVAEIGNSERMVVTDVDLQSAATIEARKFPGQEQEVLNYYSNNRSALESLRAVALEAKVINFIVQSASVTDKAVSFSELQHAALSEVDTES